MKQGEKDEKGEPWYPIARIKGKKKCNDPQERCTQKEKTENMTE